MVRWFLLLALLAPAPALAWGGDGHRIICAMAWDELRPEVRQRVQGLLDIQTREQFAESCTWADDYQASHPETAAWHFVNLPKDALSVNLERDCAEPRSCVVVQIDRNLEILRGGGAKDAKATALKFFAHFVGDVHQPLDVGFAADKGGRDIKGTLLGKSTTLHDVWDSGLIDARGTPWQKTVDDLKKGTTKLDRMLRSEGAPLEWASETYCFTRMPVTGYVDNAGGFKYDEVYVSQNLPAVLDLMMRAALRLGHALNEALK